MNTTTENINLSKKEMFISPFVSQENGVECIAVNNSPVLNIIQEAKKALSNLDFPTSKTEEWKYSRVNKILNNSFKFHKTEEGSLLDVLKNYHIPAVDCIEIVFVNGYLRKDLSTCIECDQYDLLTISEAIEKKADQVNSVFGKIAKHKSEIFTSLNTAYTTDGMFLHIKKGEIEKPIHFIHLSTGDNIISQCRNIIISEPNTKANIIMSYRSSNSELIFNNQVTEIRVKENASLIIDKLQRESENSFHISNEYIDQDSNSNFTINTYTMRGSWIRNNLAINLNGEGIDTKLYGLYQPNNKSHIDNHTLVNHNNPNCVSTELYKGLLYDKSTGVFNGKVIVHPDAQQTNAYQTNANILMSDDAHINSKPELEIYADDVKCSHGSTTGQFDEEALFYLKARGISHVNSKKLLTEAFLSEVVDHSQIGGVRELVRANFC